MKYALYDIASGAIVQTCTAPAKEDVDAICGEGQGILEMPDGVLDMTHKVVAGEFVPL